MEVMELGGPEVEPIAPAPPSPWPGRLLLVAVVLLAVGAVVVGRWRSATGAEVEVQRETEPSPFVDVRVQVVRSPEPGQPELVLDVASPDGEWTGLTLDVGDPPSDPARVPSASPVASFWSSSSGTVLAVSTPVQRTGPRRGGLASRFDRSVLVFRAAPDSDWAEVARWEGFDAWPVTLGDREGFVGSGSGVEPGMVVALTSDGLDWEVEAPAQGRGFVVDSVVGEGDRLVVDGFLFGAAALVRTNDAGETWTVTPR